ncbi:MAG: AmmeMemoRadiSam system protein A [Nitrospinota bacterium]
MHPLVKLAIRSVEHHIKTGKPLPCPDPLPDNLKQTAGTFVSIKKEDALRGCIGTMTPKYKNLAEEIIQNAVKAANEDPRFDPVEKQELASLTFSVDVLTPLEKIENLEGHDIKRYGLVVKGKLKQGVLLPDLDIIKSAEQQLKVCLKKGGFGENESYGLYRFEVKRFK